jgi:hopanoid biosynthesis associated protein HpnK
VTGRPIIITADDFGASVAINEAVEIAHRDGVLSAASLMVAGDAAADAVARARRLTRLRVGLHVVAADGPALLPPPEVPGLVTAQGRFDSCLFCVGVRAFILPRVRAQLAAEIEAQFAAFAATGLALDHVNAHHHLHVHPTILRLILDIGRRFGLRAVRVPDEPAALARATGGEHGLATLLHRRGVRWMAVGVRRRAQRAGLVTNDCICGLSALSGLDEARLLTALAYLPDGVTEVYCHPATFGAQGVAEFRALLSPRLRAALNERELTPCGYADLIQPVDGPA